MAEIPLTAFEEYMLCDDRPEHPMTGVVRVRFSGQLKVRELEAALDCAIQQHPLLQFRVVRDKRGRLCWATDPEFAVRVEQLDATEDQNCSSACRQSAGIARPAIRYIDLKQQAGTRFWLINHDGGGHELVMQMHHSCTDALGVCRFIDDLVQAYSGRGERDDNHGPSTATDASRLNCRCRFGRSWLRVFSLLPGLILGLPNIWVFFRRTPVRLSSADRVGDPQLEELPVGYPTTQRFEFDRATTGRILKLAKQQGVTVNDLLARDLFLALGKWGQQQGCLTSQGWIRLAVPVSLRVPDDELASAANRISLQFLHGSPREFDDPDRLLRSIHCQMDRIKRYDLGFLFILSLILIRRLPGGLRRMVPADKCLSSCVFTNLGVIFRKQRLPQQPKRMELDGVALDSIDFIPPLRPHTSAAFCLYTFEGQLCVLLHYDQRAVSSSQAELLLQTYCEMIGNSLANQQDPPAQANSLQANSLQANSLQANKDMAASALTISRG